MQVGAFGARGPHRQCLGQQRDGLRRAALSMTQTCAAGGCAEPIRICALPACDLDRALETSFGLLRGIESPDQEQLPSQSMELGLPPALAIAPCAVEALG